jgi:Holliday junction resolvase
LTARRVLYQELTGQWVELCLDEQGLLDVEFLSAATEPLVPPADVLERMLKVKDLVAAQFSETHQITTQPVLPMDVAQAVEHLIHHHWHWKDALSAMAVACTGNGDAFERFIGAGLQGCGVALQHSLKVQDRIDPSKVVREVDLVGCRNGRLFCIDIKLPGEDDDHLKGTQLADIAEIAHSLGGRAALAIAVRPGWVEDPGTRRLAEALGVQLLTQAQAASIFSTLLSWIDRKAQPCASVLRAEARLKHEADKGSDVLSTGHKLHPRLSEDGVILLDQHIETLSRRRGEPWVMVQLQPGWYQIVVLRRVLAGDMPEPRWQDYCGQLRDTLRPLADHDEDISVKPRAVMQAQSLVMDFKIKPGHKRHAVVSALRSASHRMGITVKPSEG